MKGDPFTLWDISSLFSSTSPKFGDISARAVEKVKFGCFNSSSGHGIYVFFLSLEDIFCQSSVVTVVLF